VENADANRSSSSGAGLKFAWLVIGCTFVVSLIASVSMIAKTINWLRQHGATVPATYTVTTRLCEGIFALSSAGLVILVVITILRSYRNQ
jgi:hypothetical protein